MDKSADKGGMNLLFVCPRTHLKIQHYVESVSTRDDEYEAVTCPACTRLHFVNRKTGKLLGQKE